MAEEEDRDIIKEARSSGIVRRSSARARTMVRKPIVIVLILAAIVVVVIFLYAQIYSGNNQSYKIENYNALWNESLADLRSGNLTIDEYCFNSLHDEDFCNQYKSLQYF